MVGRTGALRPIQGNGKWPSHFRKQTEGFFRVKLTPTGTPTPWCLSQRNRNTHPKTHTGVCTAAPCLWPVKGWKQPPVPVDHRAVLVAQWDGARHQEQRNQWYSNQHTPVSRYWVEQNRPRTERFYVIQIPNVSSKCKRMCRGESRAVESAGRKTDRKLWKLSAVMKTFIILIAVIASWRYIYIHMARNIASCTF